MNINFFNKYVLSKIDKNSFYLGFMKAYNVPILPKKNRKYILKYIC